MSSDPVRVGRLLARGSRADVHEWDDDDGDARRVVKRYRGDTARREALSSRPLLPRSSILICSDWAGSSTSVPTASSRVRWECCFPG
ncbi:hypothetical protein [Frondihabitans sucicola]|uniref:hypothetical protein n=1 Tax=Frondihabitans sucicola TaxID=1268041 RepID=UPI00257483F9|nr:hypothetical protein [Frondihabitans sucicola]